MIPGKFMAYSLAVAALTCMRNGQNYFIRFA
jgi:hypothetical protein